MSADGLRVKKWGRTDSKNESTTTYRYNNGLLLSETRQASSAKGTETLRYYYDASGRVTSIGYVNRKGVETGYFPVYNGQGDVIAIYRSADGVLMGTYEYDLWENLSKQQRHQPIIITSQQRIRSGTAATTMTPKQDSTT